MGAETSPTIFLETMLPPHSPVSIWPLPRSDLLYLPIFAVFRQTVFFTPKPIHWTDRPDPDISADTDSNLVVRHAGYRPHRLRHRHRQKDHWRRRPMMMVTTTTPASTPPAAWESHFAKSVKAGKLGE